MGEGGREIRKGLGPMEFVKDLLLGGMSASVSKTINAPIERIKIILQTQHLKPPELRYNGLVDAAIRIPKTEGFLSLWRGNATNVLRYFPTQALNFAFKDQFKAIFVPLGSKGYGSFELMCRNMLSGGAAGGTSLAFVYPLDLARTRLSADIGKERKYKGFGDVIVQAYKNEGGVPALYRGFVLSVAGIIPYRAVYFGGYDTLKFMFLSGDQKPSFWKKWGVSQANTICAQYLTYPIDTVRRRLMMKGEKEGKKAAAAAPAPGAEVKPAKPAVVYRNAFHCAQVIVQEEGVAGLFKGAWANTIRATGGALCIVFYDELQDYLEEQRNPGAPKKERSSSE